jgi:hypothetical protein|tara:strand:+ start:1812 stop:2072 length:261 start_codon:yes stop_codon:yes gene_type:complete
MASSRNNALEFSSVGSILLTNGDNSQGNFGAIQVLQDTTFGDVFSTNVDQATHTAFNGKTLGAGTILYGKFESVAVTSGLVQLHRV